MKELIWLFITVITFFVIAATSEARGGRTPHKIPKNHRHLSVSRCLHRQHWIKGCR